MTQIRPHQTGYTATDFEIRTDKIIARNEVRYLIFHLVALCFFLRLKEILINSNSREKLI